MPEPTTGPWTRFDYRIFKMNGEHVDRMIATTATNNRERTAEAEANARLIAAAPDLLAIAKDCQNYLESILSPCDDGCECILHPLEKAIAKAKGSPLPPPDQEK